MRNYSKTGGKVGKPGYRTSSMFINKVFAQVKKIPKGKTLTYKEVANLVGSPNAYRAVGSALNKNGRDLIMFRTYAFSQQFLIWHAFG
ncbi:MAG: cysteine methyltransferase [Candidatus Moranbacteria bacterium GW2011_GWD1_36_198]|nr:MAG: cysteine methyltransferase [Candidatus Moranbacteria bacterium GW2011_GWD1_36_198]